MGQRKYRKYREDAHSLIKTDYPNTNLKPGDEGVIIDITYVDMPI
jgi:hypothetical protein